MAERVHRHIAGWIAIALLAGCAAPAAQDEAVGVVVSALSPCDETVPADRFVDGIPAYAQCAEVESGAVYSNNGVDTSTTSLGSDWVRTQWSGGYQCTELATRYLHFVWDIDWTPNGNAGTWCDSQPPASSGMVQTTMPVHGDIMVLGPGSCGASPSTGHVNVIDVVEASGQLSAVEQNRAGRGRYQLSCASCFLHVVANADGVAPGGNAGAGGGGAAGASGAAGSGAAGSGAGMAGGGAAGTPAMQPAAGAPAPITPDPAPTPVPSMPAPVLPPATVPPPAPTPAPSNIPIDSTAPVILVPERKMAAEDSGCAVVDVGAHHAASSMGLLALLGLCAARSRGRTRRAPVQVRCEP